jgi:hypothetical protein
MNEHRAHERPKNLKAINLPQPNKSPIFMSSSGSSTLGGGGAGADGLAASLGAVYSAAGAGAGADPAVAI